MARSGLVAWSDQQDGHIQLQNFLDLPQKILRSFGTFFTLLFDGAAGGMEWFGWILGCRGPVCLLIGSVSSGLLEYQYIIRGVARHGTHIHPYACRGRRGWTRIFTWPFLALFDPGSVLHSMICLELEAKRSTVQISCRADFVHCNTSLSALSRLPFSTFLFNYTADRRPSAPSSTCR